MGKCIDNNDILYFLDFSDIRDAYPDNPQKLPLVLCGLNTITNQLVFTESFIPTITSYIDSIIISNGNILFGTYYGKIGKVNMSQLNDSNFNNITYCDSSWPTNFKNNSGIVTHDVNWSDILTPSI
jgi:hypothetical protein